MREVSRARRRGNANFKGTRRTVNEYRLSAGVTRSLLPGPSSIV